ncbi:unnamed protein product [Arabidopsis thaliana]|uniref:(thale cress) hypothetical protein n=1 Tax=Arabidopsis thaliana TaxID=3702 RepID=A0A7G2FCE4_ARATH|nr:unnamed protein product [Arabidopsis thaliana]
MTMRSSLPSSSSAYSLASTSLSNRLETIFKKASELCTLCDIEACVIYYGPDGELKTWPPEREKVRDIALSGKIVSISGALVVVLYKGPKVLDAASFTSFESCWIIGGLLITSQYLLVSVWYILQSQVMEIYPEEITVVFFYNLCEMLISPPVCRKRLDLLAA